MILMAAQGMSSDEIATRLDTRREVVSMWCKRCYRQRLAGLEERARPGRFRALPPEIAVEIKALACELPASRGLPLSRLSVADVARQAERCGLVAAGFATVPYDHLRAIFLSRLLKW